MSVNRIIFMCWGLGVSDFINYPGNKYLQKPERSDRFLIGGVNAFTFRSKVRKPAKKNQDISSHLYENFPLS